MNKVRLFAAIVRSCRCSGRGHARPLSRQFSFGYLTYTAIGSGCKNATAAASHKLVDNDVQASAVGRNHNGAGALRVVI